VIFEVGSSSAVRVGYRSNVCVRHGQEEDVREAPVSRERLTYPSLACEFSDCDAVVSRQMDDRIIRELHVSAIDACVCQAASVDEAALSFAQGRLRKLEAGVAAGRPLSRGNQ
jgi:hypothetical protein